MTDANPKKVEEFHLCRRLLFRLMLDLMLSSDEILIMIFNNIIKSNKIGIYNGSYKAVELAVMGRVVK